MKKVPRHFVLVGLGILVFIGVGFLLRLNQVATFASTPKQTPTVNKRINARYLQNHSAKDFVKAGQFGQLVAAATFFCNDKDSIMLWSVDHLTHTPIEVSNGNIEGTCNLTFGFDPAGKVFVYNVFTNSGLPGSVTEIDSDLFTIGIRRWEYSENGFVLFGGSTQVLIFDVAP